MSSSGIFGRYGNHITFSDDDDLLTKLNEIDGVVPKRTAGRTSDDRERWTLVRLLRALDEISALSFPIEVVKDEGPDFVFHCCDGTKKGVEVTEAGSETGQKAMTDLERSPPGTTIVGEALLRRRGERGNWPAPYTGSEILTGWLNEVTRALTTKTVKLKGPDFDLYDENWLVIVDQIAPWILSGDYPEAAALLRQLQNLLADEHTLVFDVVSILRGDGELLHDMTRRLRAVPGKAN